MAEMLVEMEYNSVPQMADSMVDSMAVYLDDCVVYEQVDSTVDL